MSFLPCFNKGTGETERQISIHRAHVEYQSYAKGYINNEVKTTHYTWWNFVAKNLYEQFSILANVYFLLIAVLQIIPQFTVSNGLPTMLYPLAFIIFVSILRSGFEDFQRYRADKKRNGHLYDVVAIDPTDGKPSWYPTESGSLQVGNIIRVKKNEMVPSDLLLLGTSNPKGICFIDKSNLNGETKLEVYSSIRETRFTVPFIPEGITREEIDGYIRQNPSQEIVDSTFNLQYELPNKVFDSFRGTLFFSGPEAGGLNRSHSGIAGDVEMSNSASSTSTKKEIRCSGHDLIMRECILRNTHYIYGLIVYTGDDTKIQRSTLESEKPPLKVSQIMRKVNVFLIGMFLLQVILCIVGGAITGAWYLDNGSAWYFDDEAIQRKDAIIVGVYAFFTWMINLSYLVPVSFIVSAEMVKFIMSFFINMDVLLYNPEVRKAAHCNNSTIHDDLGLVNYICSDKTGTLTKNKMEFRYAMCSDNNEYGSKLTDIARSVIQRKQELEDRNAGVYKPKPLPLWSELSAKFHPPRHPNKATGYDIECCNSSRCCPGNKCPDFLKYCCWSKKHYVPPGQKDPWSDDVDNEESIFAALNPSLAGEDANCFNKEERRQLLSILHNPDTSQTAELHRKTIHTYMLHSALSNTVKPYYEGSKQCPILKFQCESAEEKALVEFASKLGYTKLPEREEHEKTQFEKETGANTYLQIQQIDSKTLKPVDEGRTEMYTFLAVLGFTSARARVTVIYQDLQTGKIISMIKGQDTTVMPFLTLEGTNTTEEKLLSTLKECCDFGLRTLVNGHSENDLGWWTENWGPKYNALKDATLEEAERTKREHELFEQIESSAKFTYLGCIGLEDQLQPLVPETISACLRAGIKVVMITGDKLEVARNIGLACSLIEADMAPQIKAGDSVQQAMTALEDSRLIEITGEWNSLFQNQTELSALFDIIDFNHDGYISVAEIAILMQTLHTGISEEVLSKMVLEMLKDQLDKTDNADKNIKLTTLPDERAPPGGSGDSDDDLYRQSRKGKKNKKSRRPRDLAYDNSDEEGYVDATQDFLPRGYSPSRSRLSVVTVEKNRKSVGDKDPRSIAVDKESFIAILQQFEKSPYEAILYDITSGLERFERIQDHQAYPVSILLSREALLVMYPELGAVEDPRWEKASPEQLEDLRRAFFFLISVSKSLVFARAQPTHKKKIVTEIMARIPGSVTLAIGDGSNDVAMITAAHIGVGIAGVEGTGAQMAADYSTGTFMHLHGLLFAHGFWSYQRVANLVNFIFYKAALLAFVQFLFGIDSGFSGQQFFSDMLLQCYNVIFTALPVIFTAVMDKHLPRQTAQNNVIAYKEQQHQSFNFYVFSLWIIRAMVHSVLLYFIPKLCLTSDIPFPNYGSDGSLGSSDTIARGTMDLWWFSTLVFYATTLLPTINIFFITKSIQFFNWLAMVISIISIVVIPTIFSSESFDFLSPELTGIIPLSYASPTWWLVLIITLAVPFLAELSWQVIVVQYFPSLTQILQEQLYVVRSEEKRLNKDQDFLNDLAHSGGDPTLIRQHSKSSHLPMSSPTPQPGLQTGSSVSGSSGATTGDTTAAGTSQKHRKFTIITPDGGVIKHEGGLTTPMSPIPSYGTMEGGNTDIASQGPTEKKKVVLQLQRPVLQPEDEHVWFEVKSDNVFTKAGNVVKTVDGDRAKKADNLVNVVLQQGESHSSNATKHEQDAMRAGFVRALLRFRNQTGSIFDSSAKSENHDVGQATKIVPQQQKVAPPSHKTTDDALMMVPLQPTGKSKAPMPASNVSSIFVPTPQQSQSQPQPQAAVAPNDDDREMSFEESICRSIPDN